MDKLVRGIAVKPGDLFWEDVVTFEVDNFYRQENQDCLHNPCHHYYVPTAIERKKYFRLATHFTHANDLAHLSLSDQKWLQEAVVTVQKEANKKRKEAIDDFLKNPFQPYVFKKSCSWTEHCWVFNSHYFDPLSEPIYGLTEDQSPREDYNWYLLDLLIFPLKCFLGFIVFETFGGIWWPIKCYLTCGRHNISVEERRWLTSALERNQHLSAANIETFILAELNKIAAELTQRYPNNPFLAHEGKIEYEVGSADRRWIETVTVKTFELSKYDDAVFLVPPNPSPGTAIDVAASDGRLTPIGIPASDGSTASKLPVGDTVLQAVIIHTPEIETTPGPSVSAATRDAPLIPLIFSWPLSRLTGTA